MKKVLIISYYTPPLGMSGVMRVTKFAKYLPRFDWQPLILTTKPIAYYHYDCELLNDLKDIPIFRSNNLDLARLSYLLKIPRQAIKKSTGKTSMLSNFLFYPDAKSPWIRFALKLGCKIINQQKPDLIFATSPPFSALMVGIKLKQKFNLPLVTDFRDPWPTGFVAPPQIIRNRIIKLRQQIINQSDQVTAVNQQTKEQIDCPSAIVIENGYDPSEFNQEPVKLTGFNIVHTGNIWEIFDNLKLVMQAIAEIPDVRLTLVGNCDKPTLQQIKQYKNVEYLGTCSHQETISIIKGASMLLYLSKPNQAVGIKLYEYFGAHKPILAVCDQCNEAMRLIENHQVGLTVSAQIQEIKPAILSIKNNKLIFSPRGLEKYNRINQTQQLSGVFNRLVI
ncbi:MAG: glycosyltransferase [Candidatus Latescibacteria bacterium]|nr:glycosyltransferase [Candidatus Latescibacterota bacterium]